MQANEAAPPAPAESWAHVF